VRRKKNPPPGPAENPRGPKVIIHRHITPGMEHVTGSKGRQRRRTKEQALVEFSSGPWAGSALWVPLSCQKRRWW
jgi:hypothetical protein